MKSPIEEMANDLDWLRKSTDFSLPVKESGYLMVGSSCDSSNGSSRRMSYVEKALESQEIRKAILNKAYFICKEEILSAINDRKTEEIFVSEIEMKIKDGIL